MKKLAKILFVSVLVLSGVFFLGVSTPVAASSQQQQVQQDNQTVWDVIQNNDQLSDFETLLRAAGLTDNLNQDGPFTVFAPTNAALASLETMAANSEATVTEILLYHLVNGQYNGPAVANQDTLPTLMGERVDIQVQGGEIMLNDEVRVSTTDIMAENGIVHIIDTVLLPPVNSLLISNRGSAEDSLAQVLEDDGRFTTFLSLVEDAGYMDELNNLSQNYTVFVPTDAALAGLSAEQFENLTRMDGTLETIIGYHLVGDQLGINQIATDDYIPTLEGRPLIVTTNENQAVLINGKSLTEFNIIAANGVIHVVENVLTP